MRQLSECFYLIRDLQAMYRDTDNRSVEDLDRVCHQGAVHLILAGSHEYLWVNLTSGVMLAEGAE